MLPAHPRYRAIGKRISSSAKAAVEMAEPSSPGELPLPTTRSRQKIMKAILATCAVSLLAPLIHAPASDELALGVSKGTKLTKHFEMSVEFEMKSASLKLGGRELPKELLEKIEMSFAMGEAREIEDEYAEIDGSRAKELVRTFHKAPSTRRGTW